VTTRHQQLTRFRASVAAAPLNPVVPEWAAVGHACASNSINCSKRPNRSRLRWYLRQLVTVPALTLRASRIAALLTLRETTRQAHGAFARVSPVAPVAVMGEFDALITSASDQDTRLGYTGALQIDVEPWQGVHGIATSEVLNRGGPDEHLHTGWWLTAAWFPLPHVDTRFDTIWRTSVGVPNTLTYLLQLQVYL